MQGALLGLAEIGPLLPIERTTRRRLTQIRPLLGVYRDWKWRLESDAAVDSLEQGTLDTHFFPRDFVQWYAQDMPAAHEVDLLAAPAFGGKNRFPAPLRGHGFEQDSRFFDRGRNQSGLPRLTLQPVKYTSLPTCDAQRI